MAGFVEETLEMHL